MKKLISILIALIISIYGIFQINPLVRAEQSGSSPESGTNSRLKTAYDWLVAKGSNYGASDAVDWNSTTNDWGTYWNRLMESAAWEPNGSAIAADVPSGLTFYSASNDRTHLTGSLFENHLNVAYDDLNCAANNSESIDNCTGIVNIPVKKPLRLKPPLVIPRCP